MARHLPVICIHSEGLSEWLKTKDQQKLESGKEQTECLSIQTGISGRFKGVHVVGHKITELFLIGDDKKCCKKLCGM